MNSHTEPSHEQCSTVLSAEEVDALIVDQLNRMSLVDREKALFDVHGVASDSLVNETPELVTRSLGELQTRIDQIKDKDAYTMALSQDPSFVHNRHFRIKYLRCKSFDPTEAAAKFVRFFKVKLELFGVDRLTKTITLDDLDAEDTECLNSGFCTILPLQDRAGRTVVCWTQQLIGTFSLQSTVRNILSYMHGRFLFRHSKN